MEEVQHEEKTGKEKRRIPRVFITMYLHAHRKEHIMSGTGKGAASAAV
eukprot:CAMPEP_0119367688 /NCGR_PEP_ID=MMETSP1334-20130426/14453_1 /TAXON_ID=127549 /ORGANISM="Calcidiscus leptoporus, Strain RCC1130" /LENGTH=47 /DNA_ID= /DNA_START= /DNA_END= /DNA_ORIENTATION=